ncbi:conserved hypothetical protein [Shewanella halifaxensis HAW-EB4]|uniref:Uncharacterized protein n=1 Tax=Shewanella halifaxensis (strain HAW-EB4) TaxID=458817 RepID=B0TKS5_SHEHH|nr:hypothetical protein [Shewanella halifaxensis]ABZ75877.1 conserved hypothetical protein [Shewanella halifaxensis HAW-EB4]
MNALKQTAHESVPRIEADLHIEKSAANDIASPSSQQSIAAVRSMLGRNRAASLYSGLSKQKKAIILFGARLKPSTHIHIPLENMTFDEQEAVRMSMLAIRELVKEISSVGLGREKFITAKVETPTEDSFSDLAGELASNQAAMAQVSY